MFNTTQFLKKYFNQRLYRACVAHLGSCASSTKDNIVERNRIHDINLVCLSRIAVSCLSILLSFCSNTKKDKQNPHIRAFNLIKSDSLLSILAKLDLLVELDLVIISVIWSLSFSIIMFYHIRQNA